ncbi:MAG: hypothetical protein HKN62_10685 [Phycisphaerales bacterium]|nr:hypothetical protein [Phycisphaerales bacterium]
MPLAPLALLTLAITASPSAAEPLVLQVDDPAAATTTAVADVPALGVVVIDLDRFEVVGDETRFVRVDRDGAETAFAYDATSIRLHRGSVRSHPGSRVVVASSPRSTRGWIDLGAGQPSFELTGDADGVITLHPAATAAGGLGLPVCGVEEMSITRPSAPLMLGVTPPESRRRIAMAIETDYEYFELFGDAEAATDYIVQLFAVISDIFWRDTGATVALSFIRIWETPDDLFNEENPLGAFAEHWSTEMRDVPRDTAQLVSGRRNMPFGGVAFLNGLCDLERGYSLIGYALGGFADPGRPHVFNRDIIVCSHELGHVVSAPHTHSLGVDTCNDPLTPPQRGTIMSYCGQTFTGGAANQDPRFHVANQAIMRQAMAANACLVADCNGNGIDDLDDFAAGTSVDLNEDGIPDECQDCNDNRVFDHDDIAAGTSLDRNENGVPDECEPDCNGNGVPDDLDLVPSIDALFDDDFETDMGWVTESIDAGGVTWERAVPVDDPDWSLPPDADADGSGRCYLTDNDPGQSPLFSGTVRLTSPSFDLTGPDAVIRYFYYLRRPLPDGGETHLAVEVSADGGPWAEMLRYNLDLGAAWHEAIVPPPVVSAAGVPITDDMRVRFSVTAVSPVFAEAAIDGFAVGAYADAVSVDAYGNGVPDECEEDLNRNGTSDYTEIQDSEMTFDLDRNARLDAGQDCDGDGTPDLEALAGAHNMWIADKVQTGIRQYLWQTGTEVSQSDDVFLDTPSDVLVDDAGRVYVTSADDRIAWFDSTGASLGDFVTKGVGGLGVPAMLAFAPDGDLLATSISTDSVRRFAADGTPKDPFVGPGVGGVLRPFGLAFGPDGHLYVTSDDNQVLRYDGATGGFIDAFVTTGDNGGLSEPRGLLFLPGGDLLVASHGTDAVLRFDGGTGAFIGVFNRNGTETVLTLDQPWGMRLGPDGDVYVSRAHDHEEGATGGKGELHLTNARVYQFDVDNGNMVRAYILGINSNLEHATGFDFLPGADVDCNLNLVPDPCDIASGTSLDVNGNGVPDECEGDVCLGDLDESGDVGFSDLVAVLSDWGPCPAGRPCPSDLDQSGDVGFSDLLTLLSAWGPCPGG